MPTRSSSSVDRLAMTAAIAVAASACTGTLAAGDGGTTRDASGIDAPPRERDASSADDSGGRSEDAFALDASNAGTGCAAHDYLFCEDFESASPGTLPAGWSVAFGWQDEDTEPAVSELSAHGGARSLRSALAIDGQRRAEHSLESLGANRGVHWGRVFYRVEAPAYVPTSGVVHNTMLALIGEGEARVVDTVIGTSGAHQFLYNIPDDSCCRGSSYDYRTYDGDWHCAEWQVDWTTQHYRFYIDGDEVTDIALDRGAGTTGAAMDEFDRVALGWRNYQMPPTPYDSFFDDLAIDDERVGCE